MGFRAWIGSILFGIVVILLIIAMIKADKAIRPVAAQQAEYFSRLTANKVISSSVSEYLDENKYTYSDFAAVLYDEYGKAVSVEAITYNINKVQSELSLKINNKLMSSGESAAEIPIGSLTNTYLLAGKGPSLKLRICPVQEAEVQLTSSFESAGINQTRHRISVLVTANINSSIPLYSFETQTSFEFLLAENIIVGELPETALNFN